MLRKSAGYMAIFIFLLLLWSPFILYSSFSVPAGIQQDQEEHEVTVTLKLIQVYVTGKDGKPVMDLERDDFEIYERGKLKPITDFEKHSLILGKTAAEQSDQAAASGGPTRMGRKFILIFDFAFNNTNGILESKNAALHFIDENLQPTDEVGLATYYAKRGLVIHKILSTSHRDVRAVIEGFSVREITGRIDNVEKKYWRCAMELQELMRMGADPLIIRAKRIELEGLSLERNEFVQQIRGFAGAVTNLAKALRYAPGQKHLVMFSSGIPTSIFEGDSELGIEPNWRLRQDFDRFTKELATANCALHAIYSAGIVAGSNDNIESDFLVRESGVINRQLQGIDNLRWLADTSGGKFFGNVKSYENIMQELQEYTGSYYVLGYYVSEKWDGKYNKLEVKVKRKGCDVSAQKGYYNPRPFSQYSKLEKQWHFLELALIDNPKNQSPLRLDSQSFPSLVEGRPRSLVITKIPNESLQEISGKNVEIINLIMDEKKNIVNFQRKELNLNVSAARGSDIYSYCITHPPLGTYTSRVVIRNLATGKAAVASAPLLLASKPEGGIDLYPPLLIIPAGNERYINTRDIAEKKEGAEISALLDIYPYDPSKYSPLVGDIPRGTPDVVALVHAAAAGGTEMAVKFFTRLVHQPTQQEIPVTISANQTNGVFFFKVPAAELSPGRYYLYLFAEDQNTKTKASVNTTFVISE